MEFSSFLFLFFYASSLTHFSQIHYITTLLISLSITLSLSLRYPHSTLWYVRVVHILTSTSHSSSVHIFQTQEFSSKIQFLSFLPKYKESDLQSHKLYSSSYFTSGRWKVCADLRQIAYLTRWLLLVVRLSAILGSVHFKTLSSQHIHSILISVFQLSQSSFVPNFYIRNSQGDQWSESDLVISNLHNFYSGFIHKVHAT